MASITLAGPRIPTRDGLNSRDSASTPEACGREISAKSPAAAASGEAAREAMEGST